MSKPFTRRTFMKSSLALSGGAMAPNLFSSDKTEASASVSEAAADDTAADIIVQKLIDWKIDLVFTLIGDGVNPIVEALRKRKDKIRIITVRHEEAAAFMASGYSKFTGKTGVCLATTGLGAVHLMNGIYDAAMEGASVLALTGSVNHDLIGTQFTQEVDTVSLMKDATVFNKMISGPRHAMTVVDLAIRTSLMTPGVAHLTISKDTQQKPLSEDKASKNSENLKGSAAFIPRNDAPAPVELEQAAKLINAGSKIMILAGRGALKASSEVLQLATKLNAPVAKALLGKAVMADDSPYTTGGTGQLGTYPSQQMLQECDTLIILGSNMPHLDYYPKSETVKIIQVDADPKRIGLRCRVDLGIVGDVQASLIALLPLLKTNVNMSFLKLAQQRMVDWRQKVNVLENSSVAPIKPQYLVAQVSKLLNNDAVIAFDTGAHTVFSARHLQIKSKQQLAVCGNLASMAPGLPYAIAAQLAYPTRQCVAFVGDGGFTMLMGEVVTAALYQLPVKIIIFKNNQLSMDRFEQEEMGNKDYGVDLKPIDFVKIAEACGAEGYSIKDPSQVESTLKKAFASKAPAIIEVEVDPNEAPVRPDKI